MALSDVEFAKRLCAACGGAKWRQDDVFGAEPRPTDATSDRQQRGRRAVAWPGFTFPAYVGGADGDAVDLLSDGDEDEAQNGGAAATDGSGGVVAIGDCGRSAGNDYDDAVLLVDEQGAPGFVVDAGTAVVGSNPASPIIHSSLRDGGGSDSIMTDDVTSSVSNASKPHKQRISRDITTITTTSSSTSITDTDAPKFPREIEAMKQELLTEIRAASSQKLTEDNTDEGGAPSVVDNEAALLRVGIASQNLFASIHEPELLRRVLAADDFRSSAAVDSASVSDLVVLKLCMGFVQSSPSACCMEVFVSAVLLKWVHLCYGQFRFCAPPDQPLFLRTTFYADSQTG
ncbi:hypothetical protein Pelo_13374 [Pelomyxa schiedti]|nr:hypothetical protein Pelo_13374 [Pelomyxa schiedti]